MHVAGDGMPNDQDPEDLLTAIRTPPVDLTVRNPAYRGMGSDIRAASFADSASNLAQNVRAGTTICETCSLNCAARPVVAGRLGRKAWVCSIGDR